MKKYWLILLFVIGGCTVQHPIIIQHPMPRFLEPIPEPPSAKGAWKHLLKCSKLHPQLGGDLTDVIWFASDLVQHDTAANVVGLYIFPNRIYLDPVAITDSITIEHELGHHLIHLPTHKPDPAMDHEQSLFNLCGIR